MRALFILNDPPYGRERVDNGRGPTDAELMEGARRSTMDELASETEKAGKVLVF